MNDLFERIDYYFKFNKSSIAVRLKKTGIDL